MTYAAFQVSDTLAGHKDRPLQDLLNHDLSLLLVYLSDVQLKCNQAPADCSSSRYTHVILLLYSSNIKITQTPQLQWWKLSNRIIRLRWTLLVRIAALLSLALAKWRCSVVTLSLPRLPRQVLHSPHSVTRKSCFILFYWSISWCFVMFWAWGSATQVASSRFPFHLVCLTDLISSYRLYGPNGRTRWLILYTDIQSNKMSVTWKQVAW